MQNGLYVAAAAQVALERRLETIADNIANMNTVGYRATGVAFETEVIKAGDASISYVSPGSDYLSRRIGGLVKTDNSLDFAIQGDGWFGIKTPSGVAYTCCDRRRVAPLSRTENESLSARCFWMSLAIERKS
ncbi:MAG TPA: flagellar hook-basal body complex protein [Roseiarcus sp.]|nr:flagellar hook-basal body complex protein [Roseiarcus sp.]